MRNDCREEAWKKVQREGPTTEAELCRKQGPHPLTDGSGASPGFTQEC